MDLPVATISARQGAIFTLPVSGLKVVLREPTGEQDLLLLEAPDDDAAALALAESLARAGDGRPVDWLGLAPSDLDTLVLRVRQMRLGDRVLSPMTCGHAGCASRVDITFSIEAYLDFHRPKPAAGRSWRVAADPGQPAWFRIEDVHSPAGEAPVREARFRLPTMADLLAVKREADPPRALARMCLSPPRLDARSRRRVETAMAAMAPPLSGEIGGLCPECGTAIAAVFEPRRYCLRELRERARFIYEDVDLLASRHHWAEASILAMPNRRRQTYVELALGGTG
jgi:hypothetical protein